jgi:hypothetical protein
MHWLAQDGFSAATHQHCVYFMLVKQIDQLDEYDLLILDIFTCTCLSLSVSLWHYLSRFERLKSQLSLYIDDDIKQTRSDTQ